ncbi:hypothetical protein AM1_4881 [Acaryochloris marina MBIC11017]|uniref:Uncharacterized protein n=1 Tax=Acaryochloris marina (strain MBIC 11017) TaxID=329726 RepID=B0C3L8_ACAM1|nr:hypothetical protein AM1_4881 [Acaryochloris marina MBIC11017]
MLKAGLPPNQYITLSMSVFWPFLGEVMNSLELLSALSTLKPNQRSFRI